METKGIVFKGNSDGLVIVIPEDYAWEDILREIDSKVSGASRFFKGAKIKVTYRGSELTPSQEQELKRILDEKSGAVIESFSREEAKTPAFQESINVTRTVRNIFAAVAVTRETANLSETLSETAPVLIITAMSWFLATSTRVQKS